MTLSFDINQLNTPLKISTNVNNMTINNLKQEIRKYFQNL